MFFRFADINYFDYKVLDIYIYIYMYIYYMIISLNAFTAVFDNFVQFEKYISDIWAHAKAEWFSASNGIYTSEFITMAVPIVINLGKMCDVFLHINHSDMSSFLILILGISFHI